MKTQFLILFTLVVLQSFGQIKTTKVSTSQESKPLIYDSLSNFLGTNYELYKGQTLYLKGLREGRRRNGYKNFYSDYNYEIHTESKNIYKPNDVYYSDYKEIAEKYFEVLEIVLYPDSKDEKSLYGQRRYLKLKEKESENICYFKYDELYENNFPFLIVGYFEKIKQTIVGEKFVIKTPYFEGSSDYQTGKVITVKPGQAWECIDLTIDSELYRLLITWKNDSGERIIDDYHYLFELGGKSQIYTLKQANEYKAKFGLTNWLSILNNNVRVGMTEEMCILAWGKPNKINKASYGDQWVYDDQYLYFENGKLKSFN